VVEIEGRRMRNLRVAASLTDIAWADAFLTACREQRLPGFDIPSEAVMLSEIDFLCRETPEDTRASMRAGAAIALDRYNARQYTLEVLRRMASIVSATLASGAVPVLIRHFTALHPYFKEENSPQFNVAIELISALGTFPNNTQVARLLRTLLFEATDSVHFRFAGILTLGVIRNDSATFVPAMNRFCQLRSLGPERFHDRTLMRAIFKAVLPVNVRQAVEKKSGLSEDAKLYVTKWAMDLEVLRNVFAQSEGRSEEMKGSSPLEVGSYAAFRSMYKVTKAERGRVSGFQEKYRQKAVRSRKGGHT
jgi:hypothetical protein